MIARHWQRPSAFAWLLTLVGVAVFCTLGAWQVDRAAQKRRLFAAFADAVNAPTVELAQARSAAIDAQRYPHLRVRGHFVPGRSYWLDEKIESNRVGVHAIGVFAIDGQPDLLLVDRGWIAWNHVPGTQPVAPAPADGEIGLVGLYAPFPGGGLRLGGNALPVQAGWPKLTLFLDAAAISADLGKPLQPRLLLLDPDPTSGFVRAWKPQVMPPQRHLGYAVTWFGFVAVALAIFVILHWKKVDRPSP